MSCWDTAAAFVQRLTRLERLFAADAHIEVAATWGVYQRMVAAYREPSKTRGRRLMEQLITIVSSGVPDGLTGVRPLGHTLRLKQLAGDVLAYFDRPGTSNGPTEAICDDSISCVPQPWASAT